MIDHFVHFTKVICNSRFFSRKLRIETSAPYFEKLVFTYSNSTYRHVHIRYWYRYDGLLLFYLNNANTFAPTSVPRGSETTGSAAYAFAFATYTYAFSTSGDAGWGSGDPSYGPASGKRMELNLAKVFLSKATWLCLHHY